MAKTTKTDANWQAIDVATLPPTLARAYADYKASYTQMKIDRGTFEDEFSKAADCPTGKRVIFGYNFGKLSIAIVDSEPERKAATGAVSLSAWVAQQQASGARH